MGEKGRGWERRGEGGRERGGGRGEGERERGEGEGRRKGRNLQTKAAPSEDIRTPDPWLSALINP